MDIYFNVIIFSLLYHNNFIYSNKTFDLLYIFPNKFASKKNLPVPTQT